MKPLAQGGESYSARYGDRTTVPTSSTKKANDVASASASRGEARDSDAADHASHVDEVYAATASSVVAPRPSEVVTGASLRAHDVTDALGHHRNPDTIDRVYDTAAAQLAAHRDRRRNSKNSTPVPTDDGYFEVVAPKVSETARLLQSAKNDRITSTYTKKDPNSRVLISPPSLSTKTSRSGTPPPAIAVVPAAAVSRPAAPQTVPPKAAADIARSGSDRSYTSGKDGGLLISPQQTSARFERQSIPIFATRTRTSNLFSEPVEPTAGQWENVSTTSSVKCEVWEDLLPPLPTQHQDQQQPGSTTPTHRTRSGPPDVTQQKQEHPGHTYVQTNRRKKEHDVSPVRVFRARNDLQEEGFTPPRIQPTRNNVNNHIHRVTAVQSPTSWSSSASWSSRSQEGSSSMSNSDEATPGWRSNTRPRLMQPVQRVVANNSHAPVAASSTHIANRGSQRPPSSRGVQPQHGQEAQGYASDTPPRSRRIRSATPKRTPIEEPIVIHTGSKRDHNRRRRKPVEMRESPASSPGDFLTPRRREDARAVVVPRRIPTQGKRETDHFPGVINVDEDDDIVENNSWLLAHGAQVDEEEEEDRTMFYDMNSRQEHPRSQQSEDEFSGFADHYAGNRLAQPHNFRDQVIREEDPFVRRSNSEARGRAPFTVTHPYPQHLPSRVLTHSEPPLMDQPTRASSPRILVRSRQPVQEVHHQQAGSQYEEPQVRYIRRSSIPHTQSAVRIDDDDDYVDSSQYQQRSDNMTYTRRSPIADHGGDLNFVRVSERAFLRARTPSPHVNKAVLVRLSEPRTDLHLDTFRVPRDSAGDSYYLERFGAADVPTSPRQIVEAVRSPRHGVVYREADAEVVPLHIEREFVENAHRRPSTSTSAQNFQLSHHQHYRQLVAMPSGHRGSAQERVAFNAPNPRSSAQNRPEAPKTRPTIAVYRPHPDDHPTGSRNDGAASETADWGGREMWRAVEQKTSEKQYPAPRPHEMWKPASPVRQQQQQQRLLSPTVRGGLQSAKFSAVPDRQVVERIQRYR